MAEPARSSVDARPGGVVRPLSRAATRRCSRPGCPTPATATLAFAYDRQHASLAPLAPDGGPETYDLCGDHADRTRPPHGWTIEDTRPEEAPVAAPAASDLGSERTVAVLAAALRGQPHAVPDAGPGTEVPAVDHAALDAIAEQPFDDPDLYGTTDEADPDDDIVAAPAYALDELSALSSEAERGPAAHVEDAEDEPTDSIIEQVPARTVPGAHRPD